MAQARVQLVIHVDGGEHEISADIETVSAIEVRNVAERLTDELLMQMALVPYKYDDNFKLVEQEIRTYQ
jgi:hypothetical protein